MNGKKNGITRFRRAAALLAAALVFCALPRVRASGEWITFSGEAPAERLGFLVQEYTGTVRITFLGDCTLGGEEKTRTAARGFSKWWSGTGRTGPSGT